jgi:predicted glutamine amidotransferase
MFIGLRLKSVGAQDGENTHPFQASLIGETFAFAHNGTVRKVKDRRLSHYKPTGQTDSEYAFLWLLDSLISVPAEQFALKHHAELRKRNRF